MSLLHKPELEYPNHYSRRALFGARLIILSNRPPISIPILIIEAQNRQTLNPTFSKTLNPAVKPLS